MRPVYNQRKTPAMFLSLTEIDPVPPEVVGNIGRSAGF
jgi:hypothetical protein